ncbi:MAG: hypothetical protein CMJ78_12720 [Planctomycetaceae bacterium]|nr:hypothetical protein [Planctomycetaceae bacterium]
MNGLRQLVDADGTALLDRVRYISSVSGGSWASVLYTYLPDSISDDEFFTPYYAPSKLALDSQPAGGMNVSVMP